MVICKTQHMKLFFAFFVTLLLSLCASSQNQLLVFAGPQATTSYYKVEGLKQKSTLKYGFQAGVGLKIPFENKLFFSPVAFYSMKGYKVSFTRYAFPPDIDAKDNNTTLHTFELSSLLQYDFSNDPGHFFIKAGPALDLQLIGKEKFNLKAGGSVDRKMKFSYGDYGHFSINVLGQLGYETSSGFLIFAQYSYGLASISNADYGPNIQHRVFGISIGKFLNRKKIVIDTRNKE